MRAMPPFRPEGSQRATPVAGQAPAAGYSFGPFLLDTRSNRLLCNDEPVAMSGRLLSILTALVSAGGRVVSKDRLIEIGWGRAMGDSSLEKAVAAIRRTLAPGDPRQFISTANGEGYRFAAPITTREGRRMDVDVLALLAPDRVWGDVLAALESLDHRQLTEARTDVERLVAAHSAEPRFRIGLALICVLLHAHTRADPKPDIATLQRAVAEAHEACRLDPHHAEPAATLALVLLHTGDHENALAAARRATRLDRQNWLNHARLAMIAWGRECVSAAAEAIRLNPAFAMGYYFAANVWTARALRDEAERQIDEGIAVMESTTSVSPRFAPVALYLMKGFLCFARGAVTEALGFFEREIALESRGHTYGREACANAWYGKGVCLLQLGDLAGARASFLEATSRIAHHPLALAGIEIVERRLGGAAAGSTGAGGAAAGGAAAGRTAAGSTAAGHTRSRAADLRRRAAERPAADPSSRAAAQPAASLVFEHEIARAIRLADAGDVPGAAQLLQTALAAAPPGRTGWIIPVDPLLRVWEHPEVWKPVLALLHERAV
jgi:DNA-binding winged helix-turn-helix (wHTH) protein/tetratricopeptide (TPR) repeat protein